ncbi:putative transcription factor c2h2 protein [Botrytis fragariae]|uniref:Putative transcription factor c2h2 protein n=1 Tax=Botrytis fragariae TaxID=1964551 RepID=A0A8H6AKD5_9HELO|nr:putative transcription factor c2h2 protein [Botrytis fragariae]KAF5869231.1 putative transcription factor c2h2 protein [Botrytis fragariae]
MSLPAFERAIDVSDLGTSVPSTCGMNQNTAENVVSRNGIRIEITPNQLHHFSHCSIYNHDNHMNGCPRLEQSSSSQNSEISESNDLANVTSLSPHPSHNNVNSTSLLGSEYLEVEPLSTPEHVSSFISTEFPSLQHTTLSTISPDNFQSDTFQHHTTRDFQYANFNALPNYPSFSASQEDPHRPNFSTVSQNNYAAMLCVRSNHEIADELFTLIRTKLIEGENVSMEYRPSLVKDSIQFFYRRYAFGPLETLEFGLSIRKSIRDILLNIRIEDREEKSSCILEVVDEAYYEEGWRLHSPVKSGLSNNDCNLGHDAHIPSETQSTTFSQSFSDPSPSSSQPFIITLPSSSRSKKRPTKDHPSTETPSPQSKRQRPTSSKPYKCYCNKRFTSLKALRKHSNTHNPCQFIACPELSCAHLSLRIDSIEDHLKIHHVDISHLSPSERHQKREELKQNTFLILDCTHDRCVVSGCDRIFPRNELDGCKRSLAHILNHYRDKNNLPSSFRHVCSDDVSCGGKEAWRNSVYVTGERI